MYELDQAKSEFPAFGEFCNDSSEEDDTLEQFFNHANQWPNNLRFWTRFDYQDAWNRWV